MSSRATRVDTEIQPYDWHGTYALPAAPVLAPVELPEEPPPPPPTPQPEAAAASHELRLGEIERDAFAKGYAQGQRAGTEAAGVEASALLRRLTEAIGELSSTRLEMIRRTERQVVELAMSIARQMLRRELNVDRGLLVALARVALDDLGEYAAATIRLHPDDYAIVKAAPDQAAMSEQVQVVADAAVARGGCLVECDAGVMDAGLESQFNELARTLLGGSSGDPGADRPQERHGITVPS